MKNDSTICAIATSPGNGAIAVIRLSGPEAISITETLFKSIIKGKKLHLQKANTIHFGSMILNETLIDEVLVAVFLGPHSYTGEDVVEISCHGSKYIQQQILFALTFLGAKMAEPGEYTMRAFMNGKMDLSQAEAVADLISSESAAAHKMAINQMRGGFSKEISILREQLVSFSSLIELELDFSEEDVEFANRDALKQLISHIKDIIEKLVKSFALGNVIKNGVPVAIVGRPNVGKSTLLNILLKEDKAIVSEIAGTTRDTIEDVITIEGIQFRFTDTAGIRKTTDTIESLGIDRTFAKITQSRIILLLVDATQTESDIEKQIEEINPAIDQELIIVYNKIDLYDKQSASNITSTLFSQSHPVVNLSAKLQLHTDKLISLLLNTIENKDFSQTDVVVSNARHYEALNKALEASVRVSDGLSSSLTTDFIAMDIRAILHFLGEITGEISTDEILGSIFSKFCIGK